MNWSGLTEESTSMLFNLKFTVSTNFFFVSTNFCSVGLKNHQYLNVIVFFCCCRMIQDETPPVLQQQWHFWQWEWVKLATSFPASSSFLTCDCSVTISVTTDESDLCAVLPVCAKESKGSHLNNQCETAASLKLENNKHVPVLKCENALRAFQIYAIGASHL